MTSNRILETEQFGKLRFRKFDVSNYLKVLHAMGLRLSVKAAH